MCGLAAAEAVAAGVSCMCGMFCTPLTREILLLFPSFRAALAALAALAFFYVGMRRCSRIFFLFGGFGGSC